MLITSTHENATLRSEELEGIFRMKNIETNKITKNIELQFKSGSKVTLECKTLKEAKELFDNITDAMYQDYNNLIK